MNNEFPLKSIKPISTYNQSKQRLQSFHKESCLAATHLDKAYVCVKVSLNCGIAEHQTEYQNVNKVLRF